MTNEQIMRVAIQSGAEVDDRYMYSITFTEKGLYEFARAIALAENRALSNDYSAEDARVKAICAAMHTPKVIEAYQAAQTK